MLGVWLPLLVAVNIAAGAVGPAFSTDFEFPDSEAAEVFKLLEPISKERAGFTGQVVIHAPQGVTDPAVQQGVEGLLASIDELEGVAVASPYTMPGQISSDGTIAFAQLNITERGQQDFITFAADVLALDDSLVEGDAAIDGLTIEYGGEIFAEFEFPASEVLGIIAAVIILILAFGSVLAMGLPIITALFGLGVGTALVGLASNIYGMPEFTTQMVAMIGLGVGIDYALFIVTRYREGLHDGLDVEEAIVESVDTSGRAVLFAGMTVLISLFGLFLMGLSFMNGLAIGAITGVLMMMAASITLLPALLSISGRRIEETTRAAFGAVGVALIGAVAGVITGRFPIFLAALAIAALVFVGRFLPGGLRKPIAHRAAKAADHSFWFRWSRFVQHHPWPIFAVTASILVMLTIPLFSIRLGFSDTGNLPERQTARRAYDLLGDGFGDGISSPIIITVQGDTVANADALAAFTSTIGATEGIAFVSPAVQLGPDLALITAYPVSSGQEQAFNDTVSRLRSDVIPSSGVDSLVGGFQVGGIDFANYIGGRLPLLIGAVLILSFLLLIAVFRSVLVPLKAVILNLLSIGASYGALVAIFQWGWGMKLIGVDKAGPIEAWAPMMLFAIVFGLSMDYEVFLLSRIKEQYDRTHDNAVAVADGLAKTARVITAAALIMVCVFLSFVLGDDRNLKLFGLGLAIAVFIDATIVRMLLVPATMELLGDRNWWIPKWLDRILPRINIEGHHHVVVTPSETTDPLAIGD